MWFYLREVSFEERPAEPKPQGFHFVFPMRRKVGRLFATSCWKEQSMEQCKLYSLSTCSHCKACKRLLGECGIQYDFTDVDLLPDDTREEVIEEIKKLTSRCAFPTIIIGEKVIVGFKEAEIKQALGLRE